jgi:hypothetical protein
MLPQLRRVILLLGQFLLLFCSNARANSETYCLTLLRTLGAEWEFSPVRLELLRESQNNVRAFFSGPGLAAQEIHDSRFRELFGFYGRTKAGTWTRDFVPNRIAQTDRFKKMTGAIPLKTATHNEGVILVQPEALEAEEYGILIRGLMEARGKREGDLKLRKNAAAWSDKTSDLDKMIPDELAEEWRRDDYGGNVYMGFEFPMAEPVRDRKYLSDYIRNLWVRLGLFENGHPDLERALNRAQGHVHWVAEISSQPRQEREKLYRAIIDYWADRNDALRIRDMDAFQKQLDATGKAILGREDVVRASNVVEDTFRNHYSVTLLTRETFERVSATPDGISILERDSDLEPSVDPNIPPVFKRLPFGLRGKYGQATLPANRPIPIVGLEARNLQMRAFVFLPLTDWLQHPLVQRSLSSLVGQEKEKALARYQSAMKRFVSRLNNLSQARHNPTYQYIPDWDQFVPERHAAHNFVDPTAIVPEFENPFLGGYKQIADGYFKDILMVESMRFVSESGLGELMKDTASIGKN